jgi:hypothetical protein
MLLSIVIPTYQRPDQLRKTVAALLPQLRPDTELIILDNSSPTPVTRQLSGLAGDFTIFRHPANIGGNANIIRCLEHGRGEWVWILGDDDEILPEALSRMTDVLTRQAADCAYVNFATNLMPRPAPLRLSSTEELLQGCDSFSNLLYISAGVFRRAKALPFLPAAYAWLHSFAPQFALILLIQRAREPIYLSEQHAVRWEYPPGGMDWTHYHALNFYALCDLLSTRRQQRRLARVIGATAQRTYARGLVSHAFATQFHHPDEPSPLVFVAHRAARLGSLLAPRPESLRWLLVSLACATLHTLQTPVVALWTLLRRLRGAPAPQPTRLPHRIDGQSLRLPPV